jgi:hypothetical protein
LLCKLDASSGAGTVVALPRPTRLIFYLSNKQHAPQAQRVSGCAQRTRESVALRQRWDTHTRSPCVGKLGADLPSGEREQGDRDAACVETTTKALIIETNSDYQAP